MSSHQTAPFLLVREIESESVYALDWSPEWDKIVAAGNGSITVYDAVTLDIIFHNENAHDGRINDVALKLWELATGSDSVGGQEAWESLSQIHYETGGR